MTVRCVLMAATMLVATAGEARAQWFTAVYLGANHTHAATVAVDRPADGVALEYRDVEFEARPFESPQYYGLRFGRWFGSSRRIGLEVEFIHLKAYGQTGRQYEITGDAGSFDPLVQPPAPMSALVSRYAMSHGLNLLLINVGLRTPLNESPVTLVARGGAGPALPHGESTIAGESREQYEYGGLGVHGAGGVEVRLHSRISAVVEYKITYARPEITIAGGTGQTSALTHHVAFGLAFGLSR
jgi:outer membrane protein with beta-barrel domain